MVDVNDASNRRNAQGIQTEPALDLEAIKARVAAATAGPWHATSDTFDTPALAALSASVCIGRGGNVLHICIAHRTPEEARAAAMEAGANVEAGNILTAIVGNGPNSAVNATFIAHARTDVAALVDEVERLRAALRGSR